MRRVGRKRTQLTGLIRTFALARRIGYREAWQQFKTSYNRAYHIDLDDSMDRYERTHKTKVNIPSYLEATGHIDDAIRTAEALAGRHQ